MTLEEKTDALYDYTKASLKELPVAGVDVCMVQIGNEINYGMSGETDPDNVLALLKSGSKAVREVSEEKKQEIEIVVHYTKINESKKLYQLVKNLNDDGLDYDTIGLSYYPFWDGSMKNMQNVVKTIHEEYGKKVVIAETSYCYTSQDGDGSGNSLKGTDDLVDGYPATVQGQTSMIAAANAAGASGVFYWEGVWLPVGKATENKSPIWEKYGSGWASSYASDYDPEDAYSGDMSFHFFSPDSDMKFSIEQSFTGLEAGTYYLTAYSQGGDFKSGATFELYAVTGGQEQTAAFKLTTYADWQNPVIPEIEVTDGTLTIGVRISTNAASWGTVDDFGLYKLLEN